MAVPVDELLQQLVKSQAAADVRVTLVQEQGSKSLERAMIHYGEQLVRATNDTNTKISAVRDDVSVVREDVSVVREDVSKLQDKINKMVSDAISSEDGDVFMRHFPLLCDGLSGNCGWVPVLHEVGGRSYKLLVVCLAYVERYFAQECPVPRSRAETRAYFTTKLPTHDRLPYEHHQSVLVHGTPFVSNSTGRDGGFDCSQATNRDKFVFLKFDAMKQKLDDVFEHMKDVPDSRVIDADRRAVSYKTFGQTWKFTEKSRRDASTTPIKAFASRVISEENKKGMLAMSCPWTEENYDQAKVEFLRFDENSPVVKSHDQVYAGKRKVVMAENRKKAGEANRRKRRREGAN